MRASVIDVIYRQEQDRWIKGDRFVRPVIRRLLRGKKTQFSGMETVVFNFLKGLQHRGVSYSFNKPSFLRKTSNKVISFGLGRNGVAGINRSTPLIAAIGFLYPTEFPELCASYNVKKFLVHSQWALEFLKGANIYNERIFDLWPAGIDTDEWVCENTLGNKMTDVLIYNKIHWDKQEREQDLVTPLRNYLSSKGFSYSEIRYGQYTTDEYKKILSHSKVMIFIAEHESQGLACQECMSCNVPVIAWDQGYFLDPIRYSYNRPVVPATSVPYFDERCGMKFKNFEEFEKLFPLFWDAVLSNQFSPREYILENLTLEKSAKKMLTFYDSI